MNVEIPFLDRMLTPEEAAAWKQMELRDLMNKHRAGVIPGFKDGAKTIRFHPRTIIAKQARDAGLPLELITASFGILQPKT